MSRLRYANVASTVALFVALGGASYAAVTVPSNSVGTKQLNFPLGLKSGARRDVSRVQVDQSCIEACRFTAPTRLASVRVSLKRRTSLLVLVSADLDDRLVHRSTVFCFGPEVKDNPDEDCNHPSVSTTAKGWHIMTLPAGRHTINLVADATAKRSGFLYVYNAQVSAVALPHLP